MDELEDALNKWNRCEMGDKSRTPMSYSEAMDIKESIAEDVGRVASVIEDIQEALNRFDAEAGVCHLDEINRAIVAGFVPGSEWHFTRRDGVEIDLRFTGYLPFEKMRFLLLDGEHKGEEQDVGVEIILRHIDWFSRKGDKGWTKGRNSRRGRGR